MVGIDCRNWNEYEYRDSILQERESQSQTIFRTAFPPARNSHINPDLIVAASGDGSISTYSISSFLCSHPLRIGNARAQNLLVAEPNCFLKGHDGPAYDVKFYGHGEDCLLLSCGDDGRIRGWRWKDMSRPEDHMSLQGSHLKPVLELVNPQHKGPWNSLSPIPENNAIAVDNQGGSVYVAAGDSCAYCWDMEKSEIKMVFKGHTDYLHCIIARNSGNQIITGSEDGTARIWDCKSGKCVQVINPEKDNKLKEFLPRVSCIALDASESWLTVEGIVRAIIGPVYDKFHGIPIELLNFVDRKACGSGRTLSVWNLPSCERISGTSACASIQDILFDDNQIVAVGAEPLVSRYDMNGAVLSQIHCFPQSAFSASLHPSGVTAVAGCGGLVDVISQFGSHFCTFQCRCL